MNIKWLGFFDCFLIFLFIQLTRLIYRVLTATNYSWSKMIHFAVQSKGYYDKAFPSIYRHQVFRSFCFSFLSNPVKNYPEIEEIFRSNRRIGNIQNEHFEFIMRLGQKVCFVEIPFRFKNDQLRCFLLNEIHRTKNLCVHFIRLITKNYVCSPRLRRIFCRKFIAKICQNSSFQRTTTQEKRRHQSNNFVCPHQRVF